MKKHARYWFIVVLAFFILSLNISYVLPVRFVFFGNDSPSRSYPMSTVASWERKLQEWDWVESYRLQWRFPHTLMMSFKAKTPAARQADGQYIAANGELFHLSGYDLPLVIIDVSKEHRLNAINMLFNIKHYMNIERIYEDASGVMLVDTKRGDRIVFPNIENLPDFLKISGWLKKKSYSQRCFVSHSKLSCSHRQ